MSFWCHWGAEWARRVLPGVVVGAALTAHGPTGWAQGAAAQVRPQSELAWPALAQARAGLQGGVSVINFPPALTRLDGQWVTLTGFMVPLEAKAEQTRFLLTAKPQDCEFCIEGGPATYVDVRSTPLRFSSQPFTLTGRLELLRNDKSGMYYRLTEARPQRR